MQTHTNKKYDKNGQIANSGKINEVILEQALETHENNFQKKIIILLIQVILIFHLQED